MLNTRCAQYKVWGLELLFTSGSSPSPVPGQQNDALSTNTIPSIIRIVRKRVVELGETSRHQYSFLFRRCLSASAVAGLGAKFFLVPFRGCVCVT